MKRSEYCPMSVAAKWDRSRQLSAHAIEASDPANDIALDLEIDVLTAPILSLDDAVAKLKAVGLAFIEGERTDGADADALNQTIRWLEAHGAQSEKR